MNMNENTNFQQTTKIKVFGVGGAGCNAVNRMVESELRGAEFYVCNTDMQSLDTSSCENKIILGRNVTKGQGAGANPEKGKEAALESEQEIREAIKGADMVFITAGLGGGTGTGAAPVFARLAKEEGCLTVGVVTKPFDFEGRRRGDQTLIGLDNLKEHVDSLIIISNNKVLEEIGNIAIPAAFKEADNVLRQGVQAITDLISVPALINLDFADVKTVMQGQGSALIGVGMSSGDAPAEAARKAIESKLLEAKITGAKNAMINVTGGTNLTIQDATSAVETIRQAAGNDIDIIFGVAINEKLGDDVIVTVIATGFDLPKTRSSVDFMNGNDVKNNDSASNFNKIDESENDDVPSFFHSSSRF